MGLGPHFIVRKSMEDSQLTSNPDQENSLNKDNGLEFDDEGSNYDH